MEKFHQILMNIMTLYFIRDESKLKSKTKKMPLKKMSKTKRRKMKRLRLIKKKDSTKMDVEGSSNLNQTPANTVATGKK